MAPSLFRPLAYVSAICLCLHPLACQSQQRKATDFSKRKAALEQQQTRAAYDSLHVLLATHYTDLSAPERATLRKTLEKHATWAFDVLCPDTEPGPKIVLKGQVTDENGKPLPGAKLHIFHTDQQGYYSPLDAAGSMLENDPRLEGFLTTDALGAFEIRTVRPASYPTQ